MGQELIALNGNEQFPYQLTANDIANAMGLPNGIAPGGYNSDGAITTTSIANSSGEVLLEDNAWNNVVEVSGETTSITLPSSDPTNAIITFYPKTPPASSPNSTWTLEANSGQYIYSPTTGITNNTTTSIDVPYTNSLTVLSRGNGEIDIIGGTYLLTNNLYPSILNPLTIPNAVGNNNPLAYGQAIEILTPTSNETITPKALITILIPVLSSAQTYTIEPGSFLGQKIQVLGGAYGITIQTNETNDAEPYFIFADGSSSDQWVIPAGHYGNLLLLYWDGANWRATTQGQTIVAPATQNNAAVQAGQLTGAIAIAANAYANGGSSVATTSTFTAPCNGKALIFGYAGTGTANNLTSTLSASLSGIKLISNTEGQYYSSFVYAELPMNSGEQSTFSISTTNSGDAISNGIFIIWMPEPLGGA